MKKNMFQLHKENKVMNDPTEPKLSGWLWLRTPAAKPSCRSKNSEGQPWEEFCKIPANFHSNDNAPKSRVFSYRGAVFVGGLMIFLALSAHYKGAVVNYVVLNTDDKVLESVMEESPDVLAAMLNEMTIGE